MLKLLLLSLIGINVIKSTTDKGQAGLTSNTQGEVNYPQYNFSGLSSSPQNTLNTSKTPSFDLVNTTYKFTGDANVTLPSYNLNLGKIELVPSEQKEVVVNLQDKQSPDVNFDFGSTKADVNLGQLSKVQVKTPELNLPKNNQDFNISQIGQVNVDYNLQKFDSKTPDVQLK